MSDNRSFDRKTDAEILQELDETENPVTRGVLKGVCVSRLRDSIERERRIVAALKKAGSIMKEIELGGEFWADLHDIDAVLAGHESHSEGGEES